MSGDGGPAFPVLNDRAILAHGMSKRELFAAMAMQGLLAAGPHDCTRNTLVADAVVLADDLLSMLAILAARERDDG